MMIRYLFLVCVLCVSCTTATDNSTKINVVTAIPSVEPSPTIASQEIPFVPAETCDFDVSTVELPDYVASDLDWITIDGSQLALNDTRYTIFGLNYYPRMSPFEHFLIDSEAEIIGKELDVIEPSGINTLRIFLSFEQLFKCKTQAIPNAETFSHLDEIIATIASKDFRLIIVLHREIDDIQESDWKQVKFVTQRYVSEPAILAWDVLDKGDLLYNDYSTEAVLTWLANAILAIRQVDSQHLITSSWQSHAMDTVQLVDMVGFQHFGDYQPLRQEIANLKAGTDKPILLSAIGYSTFDLDETAQRNLLYQALEETRFNELAGWMIYNAFDYPTSVTCVEPDCPAQAQSLNFYGIWNTSYFPKLAVDAIKRVTESQ